MWQLTPMIPVLRRLTYRAPWDWTLPGLHDELFSNLGYRVIFYFKIQKLNPPPTDKTKYNRRRSSSLVWHSRVFKLEPWHHENKNRPTNQLLNNKGVSPSLQQPSKSCTHRTKAHINAHTQMNIHTLTYIQVKMEWLHNTQQSFQNWCQQTDSSIVGN